MAGFQFGAAGGMPDLTKGLVGGGVPPLGASAAGAAQSTFGFGTNTATTKPAATGGGLLGSLLAAPNTQPAAGFGSTATTQPSFGFGAATTSAPSAFGAAAAQPAQQQQVSFGLGGSQPTFGAQTSTAAPAGGLSFGLGAQSTAAPLGGLSFGTPASTSLGGLNLAKPTNTAGGLFGAPAASTAGGLFGAPGAATGGLFGAPAAASTATGGLFAAPATQALATQPRSRGLGGGSDQVSLYSAGQGLVNKQSDVKEQQVHSAIKETVNEFKKFIKQEREVREEVSRMSSRPLFKVHEDMASICQTFTTVTSELQRNARAVSRLKHDTSQTLHCAEMALQTKDTPPGLQFENTAPTRYLMRLVDEFMAQMIVYRKQIDDLEGRLAGQDSSTGFGAAEMVQLLRRLHEGFLIVAANLQAVHEAVKVQRDQYIAYRRLYTADASDVFAKWRRAKAYTVPGVIANMAGPTPFDGAGKDVPAGLLPTALVSGAASSLWNSGHTASDLNLMSGSSLVRAQSAFAAQGQPSTALLAGFQSPSDTSALNLSQSFQLQKPPTGSKRGKKA